MSSSAFPSSRSPAAGFFATLLWRQPCSPGRGRHGLLPAWALVLGAVTVLQAGPGPAQAAAPAAAASAVSAPAAPATAPAAAIALSGTDLLRREINALTALLAGQADVGIALPALFEIDLADSVAVAQRVQVLQARLAEDPPARPEAGLLLRLERDQLRLDFLRLPAERREALRVQDGLLRQGQALQAEQDRSAATRAVTEQARDEALQAATTATDNRARELATEEARLLAHLSEWSAQRQDSAQRRQRQLAELQMLLARFGADGSAPDWPPAIADARYGEIREALSGLRASATQALASLVAAQPVRAPAPGPSLDAETRAAHPQAVERVQTLRDRIAVEARQRAAREAEARYTEAADVMNALGALQTRRVALLPQLTPQRRDAATALTAEGLDRVRDEVAHLRLMARWYPVQRLHAAQGLGTLLQDNLTAGRYGLLALLLLITPLLLWLQRHRVFAGLSWLHAAAVARAPSRAARRLIDGLLQMLMRTSSEWLLLLSVWLVFDLILLERSGWPELDTLRLLAYAYAWYRLALAIIHRVVLVAVSRYRVVSGELNAKMLRSLRLVARVALAYTLYLMLAQALLGRGALYGIARDMALAVALVLGWRLMHAWRGEVTSAYLKLFPQGRLAEQVQASSERPYGLLIAAAAFVFVAARGLWVWLRDTALRFEQTRKALAYLFRRQLERQSRHQPPPPDPRLLPETLQQALTEDAAVGALTIPVYPELDGALADLSRLRAGGSGALLALAGERGSGKTSWLLELQRQVGAGPTGALPCALLSFEDRLTQAENVCAALVRLTGAPAGSHTAALIEHLNAGPPRVLLLDLVHNTMLRAVGGQGGHDLLLQVAQATVGRVLWVLSYAIWPFEYLLRTQPGRDVYDRVLRLRPWGEAQIGELIECRMAAAGFEADYEQLLLNPAMPMAAAPAGGPEEVERSADRFHRLIWDYADGNPRIALHFYRLSLQWLQDRMVRVRLFPMPSIDALEPFETRTRFVLACLVQHENITVAEAAASLRFAPLDCKRALELLHVRGFLECGPGGRYRVNCHWARAVQRFLQRKKLLVV